MRHSSPRCPQSNGFIEAMVKTTKDIMEKAEESGSDTYVCSADLQIHTNQTESTKSSRISHPTQV